MAILTISRISRSMLFFNVAVLLTGICLTFCGIGTMTSLSFMKLMFGRRLYVISALMLIFGGFIINLISILGFWAIKRRSRSMLFLYFILLAALLMIILLGGLMSYTLRNEVRIAHLIINNSVPTQWIDQRMHRQLLSTIGRYGNHTKITDAWDTVQQKFECCGIEFNNQPGYTWYFHLNQAFKPPSRRRVPESCCRAPTNEPALQRCLLDPTNSTYTFHANCYIHMKAAMIDHARLVRSISISIIFIFIIAMIHSMILFYKLV